MILANKRNGFILIMLFLVLAGCYYDKEELLYPGSTVDCSTINASFGMVKPVIAGKCATTGCHNAGTAAGGTVLETYDQVKALAGRIKQRVIIEKTMPVGIPLSTGEIAILQCWINAGMPNN